MSKDSEVPKIRDFEDEGLLNKVGNGQLMVNPRLRVLKINSINLLNEYYLH